MSWTDTGDGLSTCPNAILAGFLYDWWQEARENNVRSASTYKRAYESMKAYPLKFNHPYEAVVLKGIKDVTARRLAISYDQYCVGMGIPKPCPPTRSLQSIANQRPIDFGPTEPVNMARRARPKKPYVPGQGTGSYALLRALYDSHNLCERLTKDQLQMRAAPYSRTSFEAPTHASGYYTAWAGMKRLKDEGLVVESGHPKKYEISDAGLELWERIMLGENGGAMGAGQGQDETGASGGTTTITPPLHPPSSPLSPPPPQPHQIRVEKRKTPPHPDIISLEDELEEEPPQLPPRRRRASPLNPSRSKSRRNEVHNMGAAFGEIQADPDSEDERSTLERQRAQRTAMRQRYAGVSSEYQSTGRLWAQLGANNAGDNNTFGNTAEFTASPSMMTTQRATGRSMAAPNFAPRTFPSLTQTTSAPSDSLGGMLVDPPQPAAANPIPTFFNHNNTINSRESSTIPGLDGKFPPFTPECLQAGTFEIELILDNREVRSRHDRDYLQNNLDDRGVHPQTRALQIGDVLWIAKERSGSQRELVLDYIIERKRADDLVGSIKDGRYHEQKFRLQKSRIKNVIYIVEDARLGEADKTTMVDAMHSAIAGTMVCDGFFVKRTMKLDDTIRYLVLMTERLKQEYLNKDLYITPPHLIDSRTYSSLISHLAATHPEKSFHPTYSTFSALIQKSGSQTLRDMFLKLLLCTRGLGIEKAIAIQRVFPTPAALTAAYRACATRDEREALLVSRVDPGLVTGRKIGKALSRKVAEIWWGEYGRILENTEE